VALIGAMKMAGDPAYWVLVAREYGAWTLTAPPPIRVITMHRSKGREAAVVAVCGEKGYHDTDDAELRLLYVAATRTKDELLIFARGGFERYGELYAEANAAPF
jgi:superfamily I DNA/RNA helicase